MTEPTTTPRIWTSTGPMPKLSTLNGLRFDEYRKGIRVVHHDQRHRGDYDTIELIDPRSRYYAAVWQNPIGCHTRWWIGNDTGPVLYGSDIYNPEITRTLAHVITSRVFADAGSLGQYWQAPPAQ